MTADQGVTMGLSYSAQEMAQLAAHSDALKKAWPKLEAAVLRYNEEMLELHGKLCESLALYNWKLAEARSTLTALKAVKQAEYQALPAADRVGDHPDAEIAVQDWLGTPGEALRYLSDVEVDAPEEVEPDDLVSLNHAQLLQLSRWPVSPLGETALDEDE